MTLLRLIMSRFPFQWIRRRTESQGAGLSTKISSYMLLIYSMVKELEDMENWMMKTKQRSPCPHLPQPPGTVIAPSHRSSLLEHASFEGRVFWPIYLLSQRPRQCPNKYLDIWETAGFLSNIIKCTLHLKCGAHTQKIQINWITFISITRRNLLQQITLLSEERPLN